MCTVFSNLIWNCLIWYRLALSHLIPSRIVSRFLFLCTTSPRRASLAFPFPLPCCSRHFSVNEFLTCLSEYGPVATYSAPNFTSPSFFSNLTVDPSDRFLLSGSGNGSAFVWDTQGTGSCVRLPVGLQSEVAKTAWITSAYGQNQIACICDDVAFSLFNWEPSSTDSRTGQSCAQFVTANGRSVPDRSADADPVLPSLPSTPKKPEMPPNRSSPLNKSILEYFPRSPRLQ